MPGAQNAQPARSESMLHGSGLRLVPRARRASISSLLARANARTVRRVNIRTRRGSQVARHALSVNIKVGLDPRRANNVQSESIKAVLAAARVPTVPKERLQTPPGAQLAQVVRSESMLHRSGLRLVGRAHRGRTWPSAPIVPGYSLQGRPNF